MGNDRNVVGRWLVAVVMLSAAKALAWGPVVMGGAVVTLRGGSAGTSFSTLVGPSARVGIELGDRFNHEISFQFSRAAGTGTTGDFTVPIDVMTLAGRYTFSVDFFKKEGLGGFTPSLGVGLSLGAFRANTNADPTLAKWGPYLELHAVLGFRYTLKNGLGIKAELAASTYGGFIALQPSAGVAWRF